MSPTATRTPALTRDPVDNQRILQGLLDSAPGGTLRLPAGTYPLADGLTVPAGWTVRGEAPPTSTTGTWLVSRTAELRPLLRVAGSAVAISDLGLCPPPGDPGEHGGDLGTAITVGRYLYDRRPDGTGPDWIEEVDIRRVRVRRGGDRAANGIALMGAVRDVALHDVTVEGGYTGVAVHWGAIGGSVSDIAGPSYHPHRLRITDLRVRDAVEGFYLSSVHDVTVAGACLSAVDIGFRLLPGDNTDRFHAAPGVVIGQRIEIGDVCVRWCGDRYAVRVAGWGRSEVDGAVGVLRYADALIRDCVLRREPAAGPLAHSSLAQSWAPLVVERADGVELRDIRIDGPPAGTCCRLSAASS